MGRKDALGMFKKFFRFTNNFVEFVIGIFALTLVNNVGGWQSPVLAISGWGLIAFAGIETLMELIALAQGK